ncbi:hypothetical protein [Eubacterium aggregans]|uniref:hypothetical protein n=1 Tax=Eubacterium aggregans TaxID=81409 RepID=UPI003F2D53AB
MTKYYSKQTICLVFIVALLWMPVVQADHNVVDTKGTPDDQTGQTTYHGNMTMVTNTNYDISDEAA